MVLIIIKVENSFFVLYLYIFYQFDHLYIYIYIYKNYQIYKNI